MSTERRRLGVKPYKGLRGFQGFDVTHRQVRRVCRCRICAVSPPSTAFKFFHSRRSDVASPATECFSTTLHRFSSLAVPPRSSSPRTSSLYLCALLSLCPAPSSRTRDSLLPVVFAVRCRLQRSDPPLPPGRTPAVGVLLLLYRGALLRCPVGVPVAVRYGTPSVTPTRYDGEGPGLPFAVAWNPDARAACSATQPHWVGATRRRVRADVTVLGLLAPARWSAFPCLGCRCVAAPVRTPDPRAAQRPRSRPCDRYDGGIRTTAQPGPLPVR